MALTSCSFAGEAYRAAVAEQGGGVGEDFHSCFEGELDLIGCGVVRC